MKERPSPAWPYKVGNLAWNKERRTWQSEDGKLFFRSNKIKLPGMVIGDLTWSALGYTHLPPIANKDLRSLKEAVRWAEDPSTRIYPLRLKGYFHGHATACGKWIILSPNYTVEKVRRKRLDHDFSVRLFWHYWVREDGMRANLSQMPSYALVENWLRLHGLDQNFAKRGELLEQFERAIEIDSPDQLLILLYEEYRAFREDEDISWLVDQIIRPK